MTRCVALYCRLSPRPDGSYEGVDVQEGWGREYAASVWPGVPVEVFRDKGISAAKGNYRPDFERFREWLAAGRIGHVWTVEQTRLERRVRHGRNRQTVHAHLPRNSIMTDPLDRIGFHVDDVPDATKLVAHLREFAEQGVAVSHMWAVAAGPTDPTHDGHVELEFGISSEPGKAALAFGIGDTIYVPAHGTNEHNVDYQLGGAHPGGFPPKAEVPLGDMLTALEQFFHTHQRPTNIEWARFV